MNIDITPGGMLSDVVENKLGTSRHIEVYNLRQNKDGEWETVNGYKINRTLSGADIKVAVEITDDLSGDRFILYQDGTELKRLDYDYQGTPYTLSLPSGVTIPSGEKLRFFYYRGVIRITGLKEEDRYCSLWYGYINRTLFVGAWEQIYLERFTGSTGGWAGINSTIARYDCDIDSASAGMLAAPYETHALQIIQTSDSGYAYKKITVEANRKHRLAILTFRKSGASGNLVVNVGSLAESHDYYQSESSDNGKWILHDFEFTPTGTDVYISVKPNKDSGVETAYIDYVFLEGSSEITIEDWILEKTDISPQEFILNNTEIRGAEDDDAERYIFGKSFAGYDKSQYSLGADVNEDGDYKETGLDSEMKVLDKKYMSVEMLLSGADLRTTINKKLSSLGLSIATLESATRLVTEDSLTFYVDTEYRLDEALEDYLFIPPSWYYDGTHKNRIYIGNYDPGTGRVYSGLGDHYLFEGARITISNGANSVNTIITQIDKTPLDEWYIEIGQPIDFLFKDVISISYSDDFETGIDGWTDTEGGNFFATLSQYDNTVDPDAIGAAASGTHCLKVVQNFIWAGAKKSFSVTPGALFRVQAKCFVKTGTPGDMYFSIDTIVNVTLGGYVNGVYTTKITGEGSWQTIDVTLKAYNDTIDILFYPGGDGVKVTAWLDIVQIDVETDPNFEGVSAKVEQKWIYDSNGYRITKGIDRTLLINEFFDYVGIPAGTENIIPQYSHWCVVNEIAYCLSLEAEEEDIIRYSPQYQFDVFPDGNIMANDVGDKDSNKALLNRDNKVVILKSRSISQWNYSGSSFYRDIGFAKSGLYTIDGYNIIDNVLYFMDKDDVYAFNGNSVIPLLTNKLLNQIYKEHLSTDSFILYNKQDHEIYFVLDEYILVWHTERDEFYYRKTDFRPLGGFLNNENDLILYDSEKFITINHEETPDEELEWGFTTELIDTTNPNDYKKLSYWQLDSKINNSFDVIITDPNEASISSVTEISNPGTEVNVIERFPKYLFKSAKITVKSSEGKIGMNATIRSIKLEIDKWR